MTAESAVIAGRIAAESLMVDTCTVRDPGSEVFDPATGGVAVTTGAIVYTGPVKIQNTNAVYEREVEAGAHQFVQARYSLHFPVSAPRIVEGQRVTITASSVSPHNVGRTFRVSTPAEKTFSTAQRVGVDELVGRVMP